MVTISPAQALLILIDKYKNNIPKRAWLSQLYLLGINPTENAYEISRLYKKGHFLGENLIGMGDKAVLEELFADPALEDYQISYKEEVIDKDPSRRYFETHLAYRTITSVIKKINRAHLQEYERELNQLGKMEIYIDFIPDILSGICTERSIKEFEEYADAISKLNKATLFPKLSSELRENLAYFLKFACVGVFSTEVNEDILPLGIYGTGIFTTATRGRLECKDQMTTRSDCHMGSLKSYMSTPREEIAYTETTMPFLKASDKSTYDPDSEWVKDNFSRMVHPFANSISGTLLAQLRNMLLLKKTAIMQSPEQLKWFITLFIAVLQYTMGGHSLHEFTAVFALPEVREAFKEVLDFDAFNLKSLFYTDNEAAIQMALEDTIAYHTVYLKRTLVQEELKKKVSPSKSRSFDFNNDNSLFKSMRPIKEESNNAYGWEARVVR